VVRPKILYFDHNHVGLVLVLVRSLPILVAIGTETDGSIVCSVNGIVGIKPTVGFG
jgi:hypothetical protein